MVFDCQFSVFSSILDFLHTFITYNDSNKTLSVYFIAVDFQITYRHLTIIIVVCRSRKLRCFTFITVWLVYYSPIKNNCQTVNEWQTNFITKRFDFKQTYANYYVVISFHSCSSRRMFQLDVWCSPYPSSCT